MGIFGFKKKKEEKFDKNLINYLNSKNIYNEPIQLLLPETIQSLNMQEDWKNILSITTRQERIQKTIVLWEINVPKFSILIDLLKKRLVSVDTILYRKEIYIVYSLKAYQGVLYYFGKLPKQSYENTVINRMPKEIQNFYMKVHDGFILFPSEAMGLVSSGKLYCLGEDLLQSEFLEEYSVKDTYMIFPNGRGDGVVYDLSRNPVKGFTYFHDNYDDCDFIENPINVMCTWINILLSEEINEENIQINRQEIIEKVNKLYYWDARVLHLSCQYFGDEVVLVYEDTEDRNIEITFCKCFNVRFSHDLVYKKDIPYCSLSIPQIPFFLQNIDVEFIDDKINFSICAWPLEIEILCSDIKVKSIKNTEVQQSR